MSQRVPGGGRPARPGARLHLLMVAALIISLAASAIPMSRPPRALAADPCAAPANAIVAENCLPGSPASDWDVDGEGDTSIQGFATDISVNKGDTVHFKVKTAAKNYRLDIYRMGYYGGLGARKVTTVQPSAPLPQTQPSCLKNAATLLTDCGNWAESASWAVPADAVSGIYFARLERSDTGGASHIVFIVRDDAGRSDVLFQTSDTTWQAYNRYGGSSLYYTTSTSSTVGRAYKVSYNRPFDTRQWEPVSWVFGAEYPMVKWMESNGYDVSYFTGMDSDRRGAEILEHKSFLSVGHDEYWSGAQRANVEAARNAGVNLAFFSGNDIFWKTRWESSIDGSNTAYRTLVSYKETAANAKVDPSPEWTGTWRDPRFSPPSNGGRPENALTGTIFTVNTFRNDPIEVPETYSKLRFWRNTDIATLAPGAKATLPNGVLGYEWNEDLDNGFRPAGLIQMSSTTRQVSSYILDYGNLYGDGTATHHLTLYRHSSGALVFSAGTVQWSWGLDEDHDRAGTPADARMQQATANLLADMGAQPATLQLGLAPVSASTDRTAPTSTITSPVAGFTVQSGNPVTISGAATDTGGGVVGVVEVSVDGGTTWHPATGRDEWSYTWTPSSTGSFTLRSRATDDSANRESPSTGATIAVKSRPCPCSLWSDATVPAVASASDASAYELGVKFRSEAAGYVTGVRFYKGTGNTGTHLGHLWSSDGTMLAEVTFTGESATGWQQVSFATPVAINPTTTYIVSYYAPSGHFAVDRPYFTTAFDNAPLRALNSGQDGPNGVYRPGTSGFPTDSYLSSNYWVDVVFVTSLAPDESPPTVSATSPVAGATGVAAGATVSATFSEAMAPATLNASTFQLRDANGAVVPAAVSYNTATHGATLTPSTALARSATFTATVKGSSAGVQDLAGNALAANYTWSFTTTSVNQAPVVTNPGDQNSAEGQSVSLRVPASDPDNDPLSYSATGLPTGLSINGSTGVITGTIASGALSGSPYAVVASVSDGLITKTTRFAWKVNNANQAPVVTSPGTRTTDEGQSVTLQIEASDFENDPLNYSAAGLPPGLSIDSSRGIISGTIASAAAANSPYSVTVTASDGIATGNASFSWVVTRHCPCSLWDDTTVPAVASTSDPGAIELGTKFRSDVAGYVTGVRFYKGAGNTGTHLGHLWSSDGTMLAEATFKSESATGWQQVSFGTPVAINAGTTYIASYHTDVGYFAVNRLYFDSGFNNAPLRALPNGLDGPNGVYKPGASGFPTSSYLSSNYWVDVVFATTVPADNTPPVVNSVSPDSGVTGVAPETAVSATFGEAMAPTTVSGSNFQLHDATGAVVPAAVSYNETSFTAILTPSSPLTPGGAYTATVKGGATGVKDPAGNPQAADYSWSFTVKGCPCSLWDGKATPGTASVTDGGAIELGVKFRSDVAGYVTGMRFYKGAENTGTHLGHLWSSDGTMLAEATFTGESATGWQQVSFDTPVRVTAGATYIASYHAPAGHFAVDRQYFGSALNNAPLHALSNGENGPNGVYKPGASGFPTDSYLFSNYWVDVVFDTALQADTTPPTVRDVTPADGATNLEVTAGVEATFSEGIDAATLTATSFTLTRQGAATPVASSVTYNAASKKAILSPDAALAGGATYTATIKAGVKDLAGNPLAADYSWSFTTSACPCSLWSDTTTPATASAADDSPYELGVKFRSDVAGYVTGVRFYKGTGNTGTHLGHLWSSDGTMLAEATFTNESATGWQQVSFATPVAINPTTTYIVSYHAPAGHFAVDRQYFDKAVNKAPLHALANGVDGPNGVYKLGASGFPTDSYLFGNYWVDVVFTAVAP